MNQDRLKEIIAELARIHKVVLGPDDPILMLVTLNHLLLEDFRAELEQLVQQFRETLLTMSIDSQKLASKKAELVLNSGILAGKTAVAAGVESGLSEGLPLFLGPVQAAVLRLENQVRVFRRLVIGLGGIAVLLALCIAAMYVMFMARR